MIQSGQFSNQNYTSYGDDKVYQRLLQQSRECTRNFYINEAIWQDFELVRDFIAAQFQEDMIKTEWVMLMTLSNKGFFSNEGEVTLRLMFLQSHLASFQTCLRFHPCPPYLQVSGTSDQNWTSYADDKVKQSLFQQLSVLRFYGPVNPTGSCWGQSVYLTARLLGRLSPLNG